MKITSMEAELYCVSCGKNTLHNITYLGENIKDIVCTECRTTLEIDDRLVLSAYAADIFERIRTKPERMSKEMREDLSRFLRSITVRVITKPYRMIKEFKSIKDSSE